MTILRGVVLVAFLNVALFNVGYANDCTNNLKPDLEQTLRGVLVGGGWRTSAECNIMTQDDKRNTVIAELITLSNRNAHYYQYKNDDELVGIAGGIIILQRAGWRDAQDLARLSDDDQRNTIIAELCDILDKTAAELQVNTTSELVQSAEAWLHKDCQVSAILSFKFDIDEGKVMATKPEVLTQMTYDNSQSSSPLQDQFKISEKRTVTSSFTYDMGLKFSESAVFQAGVPLVAEGKVTINSEQSFNWKWSHGNEHTFEWEQIYPANVPAHKKVQVLATVSKSTLDIPYSATIRSNSGTVRQILGHWNGVAMYNLDVKQVDLQQEALTV